MADGGLWTIILVMYGKVFEEGEAFDDIMRTPSEKTGVAQVSPLASADLPVLYGERWSRKGAAG